MPLDYSPKYKRFINDGHQLSFDGVRREVDKLTAVVARDAERIANRYAAGKITSVEFEEQMRALLKSGHIIASSVGRGGIGRMTQADWGKVGARLKKEYGYLRKFVTKLEKGKIEKAITPNRAKRYSSSIVMSYHETRRTEETISKTPIKVRLIQNSKEGCPECTADAARGWVNVEDMEEIGSRICGNFCLCELEFSDDQT